MNNYKYILFFWEEIIIGKIYKNMEGQFIYYPNYDNINWAKEHGMPMLPQIVNPQLKGGDLPGFFKERINNDPTFKNYCRYATDKFKLIPTETILLNQKEPA